MFKYGFMQNAFIISILISLLCPAIGTFLVLKRYSLIGDTLSHASLAGVAIGLVTGFNPIISSFIFTTICGVFIEFLRDYYKKYSELILVIIMTLAVGIAITIISRGSVGANVNSFLFGSILTVDKSDIYTILFFTVVTAVTLIFMYNDMLYSTFDEEGAKVAGVKVKLINYIFAILTGAAVSVSIRVMGIFVMSSMISIPTATAMQLKLGFNKTFAFSIVFAFIDIISGLFLSYYANCAPGGMIALVSIFVLLIVISVRKFKH